MNEDQKKELVRKTKLVIEMELRDDTFKDGAKAQGKTVEEVIAKSALFRFKALEGLSKSEAIEVLTATGMLPAAVIRKEADSISIW